MSRSIYRTNSPPPPEPVKLLTFSEAYPCTSVLLSWMLGAVACLSAGALAAYVPYKIGRLIAPICFGAPTEDPNPCLVAYWVVGIISAAALAVFLYISRHAGRSIVEKFSNG